MHKPLLLVIVGALAGCASAADLAAKDDVMCRSYGAVPGSDAYVNCRSTAMAQRQANIRATQAAIANMENPIQVPQSRQRTCRTTPDGFGGYSTVCD